MQNKTYIKILLFTVVLLVIACKNRHRDTPITYELIDSSVLQDVFFYSYLVDPPVQDDGDSIAVAKAVMRHDVIRKGTYIKEKHVFFHYHNNIDIKTDMVDFFTGDTLYGKERIFTLWTHPNGKIQSFTKDHFPYMDTLFH